MFPGRVCVTETINEGGLMFTSEALLDLHERSHRSVKKMLEHCQQLSTEELDRVIPGFGFPSVRLQLYHELGAQDYWIGVLNGDIRADDKNKSMRCLNPATNLAPPIGC